MRPEQCRQRRAPRSCQRRQDRSPRDGARGKILSQNKRLGDNKVILEGEEIVIRVLGGRWFIEKRPVLVRGVPDTTPVVAESEILDAL